MKLSIQPEAVNSPRWNREYLTRVAAQKDVDDLYMKRKISRSEWSRLTDIIGEPATGLMDADKGKP